MSTVDALQAALAGEHAAVYVLGVLGARAGEDLTGALRTAYDAHVSSRDALTVRLRELGATPVAPAAAYAVPTRATSSSGLRSAALGVERRCAALYLAQVADADGDDRRLLATALAGCAVRQLSFGGSPETLPGTE